MTVVLGILKTGVLWNEASQYTGEVYLADISIPNELIMSQSPFVVPDKLFISEMLNHSAHHVDEWTYKTKKGSLGIVGGAKGMQGAPQLSGISALKSSSGIVYLHMLAKTNKLLFPELVIQDDIDALIAKSSSILIGPGMGVDNSAIDTLMYVLNKSEDKNVIIDADALNIISSMNEKDKRKCLRGRIITPHPEEFKRLSGISFTNIKEKIEAAEEFAGRYNCLLVLKSPPTIITDSKITFIYPNMSRKLATAGSGDILAGIIGGFLSSGIDPFTAAAAGVYVHLLSGEATEGYSVSAVDIIAKISKSTQEVMK